MLDQKQWTLKVKTKFRKTNFRFCISEFVTVKLIFSNIQPFPKFSTVIIPSCRNDWTMLSRLF